MRNKSYQCWNHFLAFPNNDPKNVRQFICFNFGYTLLSIIECKVVKFKQYMCGQSALMTSIPMKEFVYTKLLMNYAHTYHKTNKRINQSQYIDIFDHFIDVY